MYYGHQNVDNYIPLCILEYKESKKHYQLLYYEKSFNDGDIFLSENEENNIHFILQEEGKEKDLMKNNEINAFENINELEKDIKNNNSNLKNYSEFNISHEYEISFIPDKNLKFKLPLKSNNFENKI